jgi:hypothetical protein
MTVLDEFLAHTKKLLENSLSQSDLDPISVLSFRAQVYGLFHDNFDIEKIYYELLEIFEDRDFNHLVPAIESYYKTLN